MSDTQDDARFGEPLFGEVEFSEKPAATLIQTASSISKTTSGLIRATPERRITA